MSVQTQYCFQSICTPVKYYSRYYDSREKCEEDAMEYVRRTKDSVKLIRESGKNVSVYGNIE